ncbi:MAG: GNAT family N-acetyltransferase [Reichenbachiella sp.]
MNEIENYHLFNWSNSNKSVHAKIAFSIHDGEAISIPKAPYAGILCDGQLTTEEAKQFVQDSISYCVKHGGKKITIKQSPSFFNEGNHEKLNQAMILQGFEVFEEVNHHVSLAEFTPADIHPMQTRRIKKCKKEGLRFNKELNPDIGECYDFFVMCRSQQDDVLNLTKKHLGKLLTADTGLYELFTVRTPEQKIIAALVSLTVDSTTCYYFIPAFDRNYSKLSPLSFLLSELINQLKSRNLRYLDLGTSNKDAAPIPSLIKYKERMGGIESKRLVFSISKL